MRRVAFAALAAAMPAAAAALELSLDAALELALRANRAVAAAGLRHDAEAQAARAARSEFELKFVPSSTISALEDGGVGRGTRGSLGVQAQQRFAWGTEVSLGPAYTRFPGGSGATVLASLRQPLFGAYGPEITLDPLHRAEFLLESAQRAHLQQRDNTALDTIAAYHEALRERSIAAVNGALVARLQRHAAIAERKEASGLAGPLDGFRARIRLKDAEDAAAMAAESHEAALGRLRVLLALPAGEPLVLSEPADPAAPEDPEKSAMERRIELRQSRAEAAEAGRSAAVAARGLMPRVSIHLNYGAPAWSDPALGALLPASRSQWSAFVQYSGDLERTAERSRAVAARRAAEAAALAVEEKSADVVRQVRQQRRQLDELRQRMALREAQIAQAQDKLALAELKFAHDFADNFDVVEAEGELERARTLLISARADLAVATYQLRASAGVLLP